MRLVFSLLVAALIVAATFPIGSVTQVAAQATCRQKCIDEEQACLKRTSNKGQCGERAKVCVAKCK